MLKDLTRDDWLGFLDLIADRIPSSLNPRGTRELRIRYLAYIEHFDDVIEVGSPNRLFEDLFIGPRNGVQVANAPVYGPAMASEIAHVFGLLGTSLVIQTGVCGGLADGMNAGDIVIPGAAGRGGWGITVLPARGRVAQSNKVDRRQAASG